MLAKIIRFILGLAGYPPPESNTQTNIKKGAKAPDKPQNFDFECSSRLAVYDTFKSPPQIIDIEENDPEKLIEHLAQKTYNIVEKKGGDIPYITIREIIENLIHAHFKGAVVTILPGGRTIKITDRGPGIENKQKALMPGYTTADRNLQKMIKGVGSGLPVAKETINFAGGTLTICDNLESGTVITLTTESIQENEIQEEVSTRNQVESRSERPFHPEKKDENDENGKNTDITAGKETPQTEQSHEELSEKLAKRQKKVLLLLAEGEQIGPSKVAEELNISLSTAYRDLKTLEECDLVYSDASGKRELSERGLEFISTLFE